MTRRLTDHSVLTFDCYGTLIDWEAGIWDAFQPLLAENLPTGLTRDTPKHPKNPINRPNPKRVLNRQLA